MDPYASVSTRSTPQSRPADPAQVLNSAGGYTFDIEDVVRLRRFLLLGSHSTYYVSAKDLTVDNADVVIGMANTVHAALVDTIVEVSLSGAAPKQNPTLFALAIACSIGTGQERARALSVLPQVVRTGTHLFIFTGYVRQFRGWGRGLRRGVARWYTDGDVDDLAYQMVKYRSREGYTHRDVLRLSHPATIEPDRKALFEWAVRGGVDDGTPALVGSFLRAQAATTVPQILTSIGEGVSWEMLPDWALNEKAVWDGLLDAGIPQTALMRQLPRLTRLGLLPPMGGRTAEVAARLSDSERLIRARVHPMNVLVAQRTYASGRSARGAGTWTPTTKIVDALDAAFYAAYPAVVPSGKRVMLAVDVSGSMGAPISDMPITCREAAAAVALVTAATEPEHVIVGFTGNNTLSGTTVLMPLPISPRQRLDDVIRAMGALPYGKTDCSLPMRAALAEKTEVDVFVIITDNETWEGPEHAHQSLVRYRETMGINAKMVVVGMTATNFSIADPKDVGSLDVVGFDPAVPSLISGFARGI